MTKSVTRLLAAITTLAALVIAPQQAQAECGTAGAVTATASSVETGSPFVAANAVDGNPGTRWSSAFSDPQWLQVDLGSAKTICGATLTWEAAYATAFRIQTSTDATTWTDVYATTTGTGGTQDLTLTGSGRYVRLYATARATQWGVSLWEFAVRTGTPTTTETLLSYNKPATASSFQDDGACPACTPAKALDFNPATRWATSATTGWVDPGWIAVDLGAPAQISKVVLQWDPAYAKGFRIETSPDGTNWTPIYTTTTGTGFKQTIPVTGTGRHVRVTLTARSGPYGYSLWEFQVYGTGGNPTPPPPQAPDPGNPLRLVWSDEFNTPAGTKPDPAKWRPEVGTGQNAELQYYTNNNNAFTDGAGNMVLEARREVTPGSACPVDPVSGSGTCQYTSARIITEGRASWTYGRIEANIKVSGTKGLWPAFWMLGNDIFKGTPWPGSGEIDIMEHLGREPNTAYQTIHGPAYFGGGGIGAPRDIGQDYANAFHLFRVDWNSKGITFSIDGVTVLSIDKATVEATRGPWVFDKPFFTLLNNAVGGDWPGPPDATTVFPQRMLVDYVRVYQ
ncbi:discoidin domain-containing protein [Saccharothrix variisporea]|uniref:F5/8 type C domain-containing protein n=1 Tax=Saccharothrix variisporea TaxID=543527 RepID=A0A495XMS9_9PSEU|nr:discoidin domain-containing protein [Saccharothrix variisporea]RKT73753.1 F5/8 type C domain-containing protein [Saccharothrix variisporea]